MLTAGYFLWMLQRVNMGTLPEKWNESGLRDILAVEWVAWLPLLALILVLGCSPAGVRRHGQRRAQPAVAGRGLMDQAWTSTTTRCSLS